MKTIKTVLRLCRRFSKKLNEDCIGAFAAQATLFILISFFPFLMFLLTLIKYVPFINTDFTFTLQNILPADIFNFILVIVDEVKQSATGALISITVISALFTASKAFIAIVHGLNKIYPSDTRKHKNYITIRLMSVIYTVVFALLIIIVLLIFVFGNSIAAALARHFPIVEHFALLIISIRTAAGLGVLLFFFLFIYMFIPERKSSVIAELPGSFITAVSWMGFSHLYSIYIDTMGNFSATYGSLTAIVLCLLWLYACMYIMFIGAEINALLANSTISKAVKQLLRKNPKSAVDTRNNNNNDNTGNNNNNNSNNNTNDNNN